MPYTEITHDSRHPFETDVLIAGAVAGAFAIFGNLWPGIIEQVFPFWVQTMWGLFFGLGAAMALVGIVLPKRDVGIQMEQIGLVAFGSACATYSVALYVYNFSDAFAVASLMLLVARASFTQWWRLEKFLRRSIVKGENVRRRRNGR